VVCETFTGEVDVLTSFNRSHVWINAGHLWWIEIGKREVCICPIDTIEGNFKVKMRICAWAGRRGTYESYGGIKVSSYNGVSKLAVWNNTILGLVIEPRTIDFDQGTTS
jgi:hypothetical protein